MADERRPAPDWYVTLAQAKLSGAAVAELNKTIPYLHFVVVPTYLPKGYKCASARVTVEPGMARSTQVTYRLVYEDSGGPHFELVGSLALGWGGPGLVEPEIVETLVFGKVGLGVMMDAPTTDYQTLPVFFSGASKLERGLFGVSASFSDDFPKEEARKILKSLRLIR